MSKKTIKLDDPLKGHGGEITHVIVREPRASDLFELGEPWAHARNKDGGIISAEHTEVVRAYIERLVEEPKDQIILGQMSLSDGIRVKEAVLDFFGAARLRAFGTTATSSSST